MGEVKDIGNRIPVSRQYAYGLLVVTGVALLGLAVHGIVGYKVVAFMFLVSVAILSLFVEIGPVILASVLSALAWDFVFIPPRFTFTVAGTEDRLLLMTYFIVVMIHAVFSYKIKEVQKEVRRKEIKANAVMFYGTLLNSLSHELRTPITTILGAADNLMANGQKLSDEDRKELLSEISIASVRLNQQVENLLNMSRLESGIFQVKKDWVDVRELVYISLREFEPAISKWRVNIFIPENLPLFKLDFGLMEQVLKNLIGNVLQHTPEGTDLIVSAECSDEKLVLVMSDTGKGFPESEIDKVFDKFYRVEGSRPGGTGLGLSIARGFVEAHHGTIRLRNLPLSGAEFTVEIATEISYLTGLKNE